MRKIGICLFLQNNSSWLIEKPRRETRSKERQSRPQKMRNEKNRVLVFFPIFHGFSAGFNGARARDILIDPGVRKALQDE
jgi:hypothetical protein